LKLGFVLEHKAFYCFEEPEPDEENRAGEGFINQKGEIGVCEHDCPAFFHTHAVVDTGCPIGFRVIASVQAEEKGGQVQCREGFLMGFLGSKVG
jgi:hypothetical protein